MSVYSRISGVKEVQTFLMHIAKRLRPVARQAGAEAAVEILREFEPPYKYASRAEAYGSVSADAPAGYFSAAQFRYVAAITDGFTARGSHRSGETKGGWYVRGSGDRATPYNEKEGAPYLYSPTNQARQIKNAGWPVVTKIIKDNISKIVTAMADAIVGLIDEEQ